MAKAKKIDLSKVGEREALRPKANRTPYWHRLRPGCFVGYRPATAKGTAGTWAAKAYVDGKERECSLGAFPVTVPTNEQFGKAKSLAEAFMATEEAGGVTRALLVTVGDACVEYAKEKPFAHTYFRLSVYGDDKRKPPIPADPIAKVPLAKLRKHQLVEWRKRLEARPAKIGRRTGEGVENATRERAAASINREMAPLRTALGKVLPKGQPNTEAAWQEALLRDSTPPVSRDLYLYPNERQKLLATVSADAEPFVRALCLLPIRPGALAALTVGNYNKRTRELTIPKDKTKKSSGRKIHLGAVAAAFIEAQTRDKLPGALLFAQADGSAWDRNYWNDPIQAACATAELPLETTTYTLRHSVITDLVNNGLPVLTIAQIAGTSVKMIEDHYGHLLEGAAKAALDALAL